MKKALYICIFIILNLLSAHAQFFSKTVIKTRPYQDIVALNPTLGIEKAINNKYSVEVELLYRNRNWNSSGGEGDFGRYYNGDGFRALLGSKKYFGKSNKRFTNTAQKAPLGWFINAQLTYSYAITYNIEKKSHLGIYQYTVDSKRDWFEINFGIGKQFFLVENLVFEFYAGSTYRSSFTEKLTIIEGDDKGSELKNYADWTLYPFISFAIGLYIK